jgi:hypothetical protein
MEAKKQVDIAVGIPDGWEPVRVDYAEAGDWYLCIDGPRQSFSKLRSVPFLIIKKIKKYRNPSLPDDFGVVAEFSNDEVNWVKSNLLGWLYTSTCYQKDYSPWRAAGDYYQHCRIEVEDK